MVRRAFQLKMMEKSGKLYVRPGRRQSASDGK